MAVSVALAVALTMVASVTLLPARLGFLSVGVMARSFRGIRCQRSSTSRSELERETQMNMQSPA